MSRNLKIWLGTVTSNEETYLKNFELDYETEDFDDPEYKVCNFCKHINDDWYDEDFLGIIPLSKNQETAKTLLSKTPLNTKNREQAESDAKSLNINSGNAILFYSGETREINLGETFEGLKYIGEYPPY